MSSETPEPEIQSLTPEQLIVADLSQAAEAVFEDHGVKIDELSHTRSVHTGSLSLMEQRDDAGISKFTCWTAWHSTGDKGEHLYGEWSKGGTEVVADTSDDWRDREPLDEGGLAKLKGLLDTSFPVPVIEEPPRVGAIGALRRFFKNRAIIKRIQTK